MDAKVRRQVDCSDDAMMMCDDGDPMRAAIDCRDHLQDSNSRDRGDSKE